MAGITLSEAQTHLQQWLSADTAVATGQSYEIAGRKLTRANAAEIRDNVNFWDAKVKQLTPRSGRTRSRTVVLGR